MANTLEVGKEYRSWNVAILMAIFAYVFSAFVLAIGLALGDITLFVGAGVMALCGVGAHVLYAVGGGSHFTVLSNESDHLGNPVTKVKYRHGGTSFL